jgi:hypothetical protein
VCIEEEKDGHYNKIDDFKQTRRRTKNTNKFIKKYNTRVHKK